MTRAEASVAEDVGNYIYEAQHAPTRRAAKQQLRFALVSIAILQPSEDRHALWCEIDEAWRKIDGRPLPTEEEFAEAEMDNMCKSGYGDA